LPRPWIRDLRAYARATQSRLIVGAAALLLVVGGGLIWLVYGKSAAVLALVCMGLGVAPLVLIAAFLGLAGWIARKDRRD